MTQKRKPDIVLKNYWRDKRHFADLCNAVLYDGNQVFSSEELEERDGDVSNILEHKELLRNIKATRDIVKIVHCSKKQGVTLAIIGVENQDKIHYAMPMRVLQYDAYSYKKQYDENAKNYIETEGLTDEEILSKMKATDKFMPVITIVVYYGEKEWDGARTLKQMLSIPEGLEEYVNDYQMNLVEIRNSQLKFKEKDNKDLFELCQMIYADKKTSAEQKRQIIEYADKNKVKKSVLEAAGAIVGKEIRVKGKGRKRMCTFFEELEKECEERGKKVGEQEGELQKLISIVCKMIKRGRSAEEIADVLEEKTELIQKIYHAAQSCAPEYDVKKIYMAI